MPLESGAAFAGYTIVRLLGCGGMGEVYLAQHPRLPRRDALKILPPDVSADREFRDRFNREADLAAALWHPHIVGVHDRGEFDGQLWIAMDYVEGTDAGQLMRTKHPTGMPVHDVCAVVTAIAGALDYANQRGLLHRDVKPANILLTEPEDDERRVLLADFGIARELAEVSGLTATNMTVGTVSYAAPEQLMGADIDGRADQYALAATAFHLLTGAPPYQHSNPVAVISQHLNATPPKLSSRRSELLYLDPVLSKALAKDPADRFGRCREFATKFSERAHANPVSDHRVDADITIEAPRAGIRTQVAIAKQQGKSCEQGSRSDDKPPPPARNKGRRAALVALGLCSTVVAGVWFWSMLYRRQPTPPVPPTAPATTAALKPTAAAPPATVTVTPAPPVIHTTAQPAPSGASSGVARAPAQFSATDQKFLTLLQAAGISIPTADAAEYAIEKAHAVCDHRASHPDAVVGSLILDNWIASTTIYGNNAPQFALYSAESYCPQYVSPDY
ncbi:serine/threonine-protein kinase [Mycobacterium intracellulare]|uniref:non-specific serine/threonine protein kinase n=1 Tax=Mycobacterium intracellulare TaxID=1767 RepID=A0AAE4UFR8_MYCIT|nr:serine/threonine-protein kinase [Mycobacterium intracellulare]MDV6979882.1 serine/threonine-protein kinase [Mycobacterium intracellulare]MDV6985391.1 serine/threonine-protein kinase [Mycobacterium intracellulare]MDV7015673.1 serine/threonine-protein kinase [Mycobacterium intracellulare]MDV7030384.1 serine/threonine-protein kinase [Mycobacterium intracellulare]